MIIKLKVLGQPKAQPRHRHFQRGSFKGTYDPGKEAKQSFLSVVLEQAPAEPLNEPLCVDIDFYFARPKGHYGTGKNKGKLKSSAPTRHTTKPDTDNLRKFTCDALNKVFWRDDSVICEGCSKKLYDSMPRTEIIIRTFGKDV